MSAGEPKSDEIDWDVLGPKRNSTYSTRIVAAVRDALFEKQLKSGDFLGSEKDLAAKFGVSRMAARDAMRTLEAIGIVDIRVGAGGGARIASGNAELFADVLAIQLNLTGVTAREIIETQQIIEPMAARLAAECGTDEEIANIGAIVERSASVILQNDSFTRAALDFHLSIAEASHNRVLKIQLASLQYVVWPRRNSTLTRGVSDNLLKIHKEIYECIAAHDGDGAYEAMARHLSGVRSRRMREYGESDVQQSEFDPGCC